MLPRGMVCGPDTAPPVHDKGSCLSPSRHNSDKWRERVRNQEEESGLQKSLKRQQAFGAGRRVPRAAPTTPKDTHASALPGLSDSVGQTGEPPGNRWQNTPSG